MKTSEYFQTELKNECRITACYIMGVCLLSTSRVVCVKLALQILALDASSNVISSASALIVDPHTTRFETSAAIQSGCCEGLENSPRRRTCRLADGTSFGIAMIEQHLNVKCGGGGRSYAPT